MAEPIAYVSTWRIREGKLKDWERFNAELTRIVDENEPHTAAFLAFGNEGLTEITTIHLFPDRAALDHHMTILEGKVRPLPRELTAVMGDLESLGIQVFGSPGGKAAEMDKGLASSGVPFTHKPRFLGGFTRQQ